MTAVGIFECAQFTPDHLSGGMNARIELFVPFEHYSAWQELMSKNPHMLRLNALSQFTTNSHEGKLQNANLSESNLVAGSW